MSEFIPKNLKVSLKGDISITEPIIPRKYTLTHSDETAELFLTIGSEYDYYAIDYENRDEVIACWKKKEAYSLLVSVKLDIGLGIINIIKRDKIFRQELPLALTAIVFGDNLFLENNKDLYYAPIIVKFESGVKEYNLIENWGRVKDYKYTMEREIEDDYINGISSSYKLKPLPLPNPAPIPYFSKKIMSSIQRYKICQQALLSILNSYIRNEVNISFGRTASYCLKDVEILNAKTVSVYGPCMEKYEVTVGVKVGKIVPDYNNLIMTFIIDEQNIKVKNVKMLR